MLALNFELIAIACLHDAGDNKDENHKVETRLRHGLNLKAKQAHMGKMATFGDQQYANDKQDEQADHLKHPVLFQKGRHAVRQNNHHNAANDDCRCHDDFNIGKRDGR